MSTGKTGADALCRTLEALGVECVFGLPGTQNVSLFDALRRSKVRTVVPTHEMAAAFMANGLARASGRTGVVVTIPGPGFTYALTGLAEARLDSVPVVHVVGAPSRGPGKRFRLQWIEQRRIAEPLVKGVVEVSSADEMPARAAAAFDLARAGEPGPVLLEVAPDAWEGRADPSLQPPALAPPPPLDPADVDRVWRRLEASPRRLLIAGQGTFDAASELLALAERLDAPVVTTTSGRGAIPEDHPLSLGSAFGAGGVRTLNAAVAEMDVVLALGVKFSHTGCRGFRLVLPEDRLVHVDASREVLGAEYPAALAVACDVPSLLRGLLARSGGAGSQAASDAVARVLDWRDAAAREAVEGRIEPRVHGTASGDAAGFFAALRLALPRDAIVVTDSGLHQMLARSHFTVLRPRGFLVPADFQSMGFGLPAAIGAALAAPGTQVVALVGDGGMAMSGLELATAKREGLRVAVVVLNDRSYGLIRMQQLAASLPAHGTRLGDIDFEAFAAAVGVPHLGVTTDAEASLRAAFAIGGPCLVEVPVGDSPAMRVQRVKARARSFLGARLAGWLRRTFRH